MDWFIYLILITPHGEIPRQLDYEPAKSYVECKQNTLNPEIQEIAREANRLDNVHADLRCVGIPNTKVSA